jgi:hypothetical protein
MGKWMILICLALMAPSLPGFAGDEDVKKEKPAAAPREPEPTPMPEEPQAPDMSLGEEEEPALPEFDAPSAASSPAPAVPAKKKAAARKSPDLNLDYTELMDMVESVEVGRGVLPPALGSRGYRPNMIAAGYGDRTPGYGVMVEYSWNRLGIGAYYSYLNNKDSDLYSFVQTFGGIYMLYRWLPFKFSPYFLAGLEMGSKTAERAGGTVGLGIEAQVYYGWTLLLGYTFHSTARKGFFGGGIGWAF